MENLKLSMMCKAGGPAVIILWVLVGLCYKKFGLDSLYIVLTVLTIILLLLFGYLAIKITFIVISAILDILKERKN
ncbi:MAG: hypothetical protein PHQ35_06220 [Phycisphaerae bacterium]|nr:hypothetical protein [Phycisphaerae bacterium]MDD5381225.1 hypothetical protein [Phycisphaerae bacterium]